jgi:hypothetical protein
MIVNTGPKNILVYWMAYGPFPHRRLFKTLGEPVSKSAVPVWMILFRGPIVEAAVVSLIAGGVVFGFWMLFKN